MKKQFVLALSTLFITTLAVAQEKALVGIVPFKSASNSGSSRDYYDRDADKGNRVALQDAVAEGFLNSKRFSLVEREKMDQLNSEKNLQKSEDFIDGSVIEQSKSLGAQYVVLGNVAKAGVDKKQTNLPYVGTTTSYIAEISFSIRVVDVSTGEIIASSSFSNSAKGKSAFDDALKGIRPQIEKFVKDNFKVVVSIASIEEKSPAGEAVKLLIAGGSSTGVKENNEFKVYEEVALVVDGKKMTRKKAIGKVVVNKVEDESFSVCTVKEGGADIAKKIEAGAKVKCELINGI